VSRLKVARQQLRQANRRLAKQKQQIVALRARLAKREVGVEAEGIRPENIVWVFGSGRTGSTWLSAMMKALPDHARWNEPNVGALFGHHYYQKALRPIEDTDNFILSDNSKESWLHSIRSLVLEGAAVRFPDTADNGGYLVIKEPHGSLGAPLLMEALPESALILLVRDPRDVVASTLHSVRVRNKNQKRIRRSEEGPDEFVKQRATSYLRDISLSKQAYEAHKGCKVLVRYEDLKANTLETMQRIYSALEIPVEEKELARAVEKHAFENIPEDQKGPGTVRRRGTSGGWREDLTPTQAEIVESITAPIFEEFYA
jgi:hypothetical protein